MPTFMVSPRDYTLRTTTGHVIHFKADEPTLVPDVVVNDALAVNILPTEGRVQRGESGAYGPSSGAAAITGTLKDALILSTIEQLAKENDSHNFNAGGQPKLGVVNTMTGIRISGGELTKYWDRYREIKSTNSPMPRHPQLDRVQDLQTLTTRKQLLEYASEIDFPASEVNRVSVKDAKEKLLQATLNYHVPVAPVDSDKPDTTTLVDSD